MPGMRLGGGDGVQARQLHLPVLRGDKHVDPSQIAVTQMPAFCACGSRVESRCARCHTGLCGRHDAFDGGKRVSWDVSAAIGREYDNTPAHLCADCVRPTWERTVGGTFADDPDYMRLEGWRQSLETTVRDAVDDESVFVASILAYNALHWQRDVAEAFFALHGEGIRLVVDFDKWSARAHARQAELTQRTMSSMESLAPQRRAVAIKETERQLREVVKTLSEHRAQRRDRTCAEVRAGLTPCRGSRKGPKAAARTATRLAGAIA
jgi:hypothetical protein